ncbi:sulfite exporter TauE/SafE family protein [Waterburya agarophytonicola K14]|uniref:Probable membrane transporter protein n=1 Tax=Waterburya agarophytonicola KI4 TaxID=2874699 RepID=A0A964BPJ3_9CYAN|nr:sulfite exporter TauE/SafE family protein [Waterburya agarophytonicola]MCC0177228.1 sulfite exporter TauE/SafE family protein [Waterburya agarophytonicola KI4]
MATWITGHLLALIIGLSLGLIGGGGSILAVPILVYVLGLDAKTAIAMSLAIVGIVSLIGVIPHWRQGNVNLKTAISFTPPAMLGAFVGARLATLPFITDTVQLVCFAVMMLVASYFMIRKPSQTRNHVELVIAKKHQPKYPWLAITLEGLGVGILTGFVGVGGGFAIIPALVLLGGIPMKEAIGTSLLIITFKSATGFIGYLNQVTIDWNLMLTFTTVAILGVIWGAYFSGKIRSEKLQQGFGYFLIAIAIFILIKR